MNAMHQRLGAMALLAAAVACSHHGPDWGVSGHVRLADGSPVPRLAIRIEWPDLGGSRTVLTDADGRYYHDWESNPFLSNEVQEHVIVTPQSVEFTFTPAARELRLPGVVSGLDFVAAPVADGLQAGWLLAWPAAGPAIARRIALAPAPR